VADDNTYIAAMDRLAKHCSMRGLTDYNITKVFIFSNGYCRNNSMFSVIVFVMCSGLRFFILK
jgi:hypothetical protein